MRYALRLTTSLCSLMAMGLAIAPTYAADTQTAAASQTTAAPQTAADTAAAPAPEGAFEEITVTARKREENLQVVPISITAYTQTDLEDKNVQTLGDLRYVTPSVSVQPDTFRQDTINITIRGLRNFPSNGIQFDTSAAVYVNGVYYARTQGLTGALFDIDTVQVLKGPQGTLVGRNATGGAILYTNKEPTSDYSGSVQAIAGDYGRYEGQGILNAPIGDKFSVRAAFSYDEMAGYLTNEYYDPNTGIHNTTPGLGYRKMAGIFTAKYEPDDVSKILLRFNIDDEHDTGSSYHLLNYFVGTATSTGAVGSNPAPVVRTSICQIPTTCGELIDLNGRVIQPYYTNVATGTVNTSPAAYNALLNVLARQQSNFWLIDQANSNYNVDHFQSVSGSYERHFDNEIDFKLSGAYRWTSAYSKADSRGAPYDTLDTTVLDPDYKAYTAEATLNGKVFADKLDWTTGAFFFRESDDQEGGASYLFSTNQLNPQPISGRQVTDSDSSGNSGINTSYAVYAQGTYKIMPDLRFTAGARYTIDDREAVIAANSIRFPATAATSAAVAGSIFFPGTYTLNGISYTGYTEYCGLTDANGVLLPANACSYGVAKTFRKPTFTVSLDYDLADKTLVYLTGRTGYKSGAINTAALNPTLAVAQPETVEDLELGLKSEWYAGDMPVRSNLAGYLTGYHNLQQFIGLPNITQATGPTGTGACTQALYNAGQCLGTTTSSVTLNAHSAQIYGGEWDISAKPIPELTLSWNGSYLHAIYTDFSFAVPAGYLVPTTGANLTGQHFPAAGLEQFRLRHLCFARRSTGPAGGRGIADL